MSATPNKCHACYNSFSGWWCDNCDTWPCRCVPQEGDDAPEAEAVPEAAVSVAEGGEGGSAADAGDAAGVHGVPVRQAQESDVAPEQEAARVETCWVCGKPGIQGQPFSGGKEFYCPHCDDVHPYRDLATSPPPIDHDPVSCIVAELQRAGAGAAIVAHEDSLDVEVRGMLDDGYVLGETVYMHGKRIRYLVKPEVRSEGQQAD